MVNRLLFVFSKNIKYNKLSDVSEEESKEKNM